MFEIRELKNNDVNSIVEFSDRWIGSNYSNEQGIFDLIKFSSHNGKCASFGAWEGDELVAIRLTYAPGEWIEKVGPNVKKALSPNDWKVPAGSAAYFKSLFVASLCQGRGLGKELSHKSIEILRQMGAKAILCHSWLESPNNSSQRYLQKMGFESVKQHPMFWYDVDYVCVKCGPERCVCSAVEMIKYL